MCYSYRKERSECCTFRKLVTTCFNLMLFETTFHIISIYDPLIELQHYFQKNLKYWHLKKTKLLLRTLQGVNLMKITELILIMFLVTFRMSLIDSNSTCTDFLILASLDKIEPLL